MVAGPDDGAGPATAHLQERRRQAHRLVADLTRWAVDEPGVHALVLVGSYAHGRERVASDVDLVLLTDGPAPLSPTGGWFERLRPGSRLVRTAAFGPVREQRHRLPCGLVAEVGVAPVAWADVPLDAGTRRVLADGHRVLHDPHGALARAAAALREAGPPRT
ncbi:nucleotidyltransferase domain-containing protein [Kineococcus gypseus]|uniref:nucleotidyltransferase domain-containing protein n=1 Tax=Kineococcus gypseus TaxID=1637102 RepID=UPI003D7D64C5